MLAEVQLQLQNAQHSLLFLQNEHAKTINGLHDEIKALQQKCGELNFQLAMKGSLSGNTNDGLSNSETLKASQDIMQKELTALKDECVQLKGNLDAKDKRILLLEGQLKSKEQKYMNDLKLAQRHNAELKSELEAKGNTIAYLTSQMHQLKSRSSKSENSTANSVVPAPPREGAPSRTRARRRTTPSPIVQNISNDAQFGLTSHQLDTSELIIQASISSGGRSLPSRPAQSLTNPPRPALGHSAARRERELHLIHRQRPNDYKDIINAQRSTENDFTPRPPVDPLPPISAMKNGKKTQNTDGRYKHADESRKGIRPTGSSGEITEVVVEPLSSPERTWKKAQNSSRQ